MIARLIIRLILLCFVAVNFVSKGVVKKDELLARWSFDEGNGTHTVETSGSGVDNATLIGAGWGSGVNAVSQGSLDLSAGSGYARVTSHPNLQARIGFSFMLWFKSNGQPDDYAQILSKRDGTLSPYFVQVEQGGTQVKSMFRFFSSYIDNGAFSFNPFQWHFLTSTYDGERYKTYIDGVLIGSILKSDPVYVENGDLGIGGSPDGSNLFKGWIDDVRLYKTALSSQDVEIAYGDGYGDFGPSVDVVVDAASNSSPIPVVLTFRDLLNNPVSVSDFNASDSNGSTDVILSGGSIINFSKIGDSNSTYGFDIIPDRHPNPQRIFLTFNAGAAVDALGDYSQKKTVVISYNDKITRSSDLVGWWTFDEANGSVVNDRSGGDAHARLFGSARLDLNESKFGAGSLLLDGSSSWAEIRSLTEPAKITRQNDLIGWWKFDEGSGSITRNSVTGLDSGTLSSGAIFSTIEKTFGNASLHFPTNSTGSRVMLSPALDLGGTSTVATFTISTWFRNLYPIGAWRTLSRGTTNGRHLIIQNNSNNVGVFANTNGDWRDSGEFDLEADGLWHQIVVVSDGLTTKFYLDGAYQGDSDRPTGDNILSIGNYSSGGQRFAEYLDDFRVYGIALTDFEVEMLYREAEGSSLNVGEGSYSVSAWVKPTLLKPTPEYNFAIGWYEGGGGEYMQAKLGQGVITNYNSLNLLNPGDALQASVMPGGVTERLFDGSYNDNQIDDTAGNPNQYDAGIDGRAFLFGQQIPTNNAIITRNQDANFSVLTAFPTSAHTDSYLLWEHGGDGVGSVSYTHLRAHET